MNFKIGNVFLFKIENTTLTKWPLGRIEETHPEVDRKVRIASEKNSEWSNSKINS